MSNPDAARESQLRDILGSHRAVASGHLRLLSLDALRERMGAKWQGRSDHMLYIVESIIKRHLRHGQTFYQANDSSFVIVFDFDDQDRAEFVCRAISREIVQRLLGASENKADDMAVEMRVAVVSCDQVGRGGDISTALESALSGAAPQVVAASAAGGATPESRTSGPSNDATPVRAADTSGAAKGVQPLHQALRSLLEEPEGRLLAGDGRHRGATGPARQTAPDFLYRPFWTVKARAFLAYRIVPKLRVEGHGAIDADAIHEVIDDADLVRALDRLWLNRAMLDLARSLDAGRKYVVIVPIHIDSLARDSDRSSLLGLLERQPNPIPNLVAIELIDSEKCRWVELVRYLWILRGKCRQVILRQSMSNVPWLQSQHLPDGAVGMSVVVPGAKVPEEQIFRSMNAFIATVAKHRIETYAYGLRSRSLTFAAIGAGFDHVSGSAVAARCSQPSGVALAAMDDVFAASRG